MPGLDRVFGVVVVHEAQRRQLEPLALLVRGLIFFGTGVMRPASIVSLESSWCTKHSSDDNLGALICLWQPPAGCVAGPLYAAVLRRLRFTSLPFARIAKDSATCI